MKGLEGLLDCEMKCSEYCDDVHGMDSYNVCVATCMDECAKVMERPLRI